MPKIAKHDIADSGFQRKLLTSTKALERMARGREFHQRVQAEWLRDTKDGTPRIERRIDRLSGQWGRVDILIEDLGDFVSVIEIKATEWDQWSDDRIPRYVRRQIRQIWSYVDAQLEIYEVEVCPGVIFPHRPLDPRRLALIERLFNGEGIQVVWHDETLEECRVRHNLAE